MNTSNLYPNEEVAAKVAAAMTNEKVLSSLRLTTGDQYFVFAINTSHSKYVIRMTDKQQKNKFLSAIYWQEKLIPLGVPLAKFIHIDLDGEHSQYPALLMQRLPGDDLCNVYPELTDSIKQILAKEIVKIQATTDKLPNGLGYGIADSYENIPEDKSWFDFLMNRLELFKTIIKKNSVFDDKEVSRAISIAKELQNKFHEIPARPFLWDASERNVIIDKSRISGIVDVDDMCFGDPLFVIGLTYTALENEEYDTLYPDYWAEELKLDSNAKIRLAFYRLFYAIVFMRKIPW